MVIKLILLVVFILIAVAVGIYCRSHAANVDGFILGGRNVGPWLSAFEIGRAHV